MDRRRSDRCRIDRRLVAAALVACGIAVGAPQAVAQALAWDVPHRGAVLFDRTTERFEVTAPPSRFRMDLVVAGAGAGGHEWRYLACAEPPAGFEQPKFDDRDWLLGRGEFGTEPGRGDQRTPWRTRELCLRSRIDVGRRKPKAIVLRANHDDGIRVYCNGKLVLAEDSVARDRTYVLVDDQIAPFTTGDNLLAARCTNVGGAQYFDLSVAVLPALPPGVRTAEQILAALQQDRESAAAVQRDLFGPFRPPALLLQGELDGGAQRVREAPSDLRELGWFVATDLARGVTGGGYQNDVPRMFRLGDLQLRGRIGAVDAEGYQDVDVAVRSTPEVLARGDSNRFVASHVQGHVVYGFDGRLQIRRRVQLAGGKARVVEFRSELTGRLLRGKDWKEHAAELRQIESWRLSDVRENQDAEFRLAVKRALDSGTARLKEELANLTRPELRGQPPDGDNSYHSGRLALGLLALLKGGVPKDDPVVQRGIEELLRRDLIDTYSLGNALMCLEAFHAPPNEFADLKQGTIDRPRRRTPSPEHLAVMERWTAQLLDNVDTRVDAAYLLRFNYTGGPRYDHSVNQYGLLGLYSAHLCGIEIAPTVWEAAANHLIAAKGEPHGRIDLQLTDYRARARMESDPSATRTVTRVPVQPAGWNYQEPKAGGEETPVWGSMTCAGITGLAICQAALLDYAGLRRHRLQNEAGAARNAGFGWLAENMSFRFHPGSIERQQHWFYYYLYGLERAALLSGVALIQDRDWYFEGSMVLVLAQQPDGHWPAEVLGDFVIERTAMAILFLKQSTLPVLTGQ